MRITWTDGTTVLSVNFCPKGDDKCQGAAQRTKLEDAAQGEQMNITGATSWQLYRRCWRVEQNAL